MRILVYGINYAPELTGIGKYTGEMVESLRGHKHEVRVVTAPPYYPEWKVKSGFSNSYSKEEAENLTVYRCPLWLPKQPSAAKRLLHLLSFTLLSAPVMLKQIAWKPDVVWVCAPALSTVPAALFVAMVTGAKKWIHIQDLEVDVAYEMGLLKGSLLKKIAFKVEKFLLSRAHVVSTISKKMVEKISAKGIAHDKLYMFRNWVDISEIHPAEDVSYYRGLLNIPAGNIVALFSGTLGAKQGLELLVEVAKIVESDTSSITLVICGNGVLWNKLEEASKSLDCLLLLPLQPKEQLQDLLALADVHLLPQDPNVADLVMPSKLSAMLASGRPVLSTARPGSELAEVIEQVGILSAPNDAAAMADNLLRLARQPELRKELGRKSRQFAEQHLSADAILANFEKLLTE